MARPSLPVAFALLLAVPLHAQVGLGSNASTIVLAATKVGSVRVGLPAGGVADLPGTLGPGRNEFAPVPIETAWDLEPSRTAAVSLVAYFQTPEAALTSDGGAIPSSAVSGRLATGPTTGWSPFRGSMLPGGLGSAGGTLVLFTQPVAAGNAAGHRTDELQVSIDLTGSPDLPAGTYQGTLNLLAITQ